MNDNVKRHNIGFNRIFRRHFTEKVYGGVVSLGGDVNVQEGREGHVVAAAVEVWHFVEQVAGVVEHAGSSIEGDEAHHKAFGGDLLVLLLGLHDLLDHGEGLGLREAAHGGGVDGDAPAEELVRA